MAYTLVAHDFLTWAPSSSSVNAEFLARLLEDEVSMRAKMFLGNWLLKFRIVYGYA